jgi:hypothetical protein
MDDLTPDIIMVDGDWSEIEIDGDKAIVRVRATNTVLNRIALGSDVAITRIDDPKLYWTPTRISPLTGLEVSREPIENLVKYLLDDTEWGNLKAIAEALSIESTTKGYIKIAKGDWRLTAQLLVLLGKAGFGLDKISTGTFPTTGILDTFDRADSSTDMGGSWTTNQVYSGATNWGIDTNQCYNPDNSLYSSQYYDASTYGPDSECYVTIATEEAAGDADTQNCIARIIDPGNTWDGYDLYVNLAALNVWAIAYVDEGVATNIGATVNQAIAAGDKIGIEVIGDVITGYLYTGGAWSTIITRTDTVLLQRDAGYLGLYGTGITPIWRYDDFGGGTVVAAGGGSKVPLIMAQMNQFGGGAR